jgi:hypothetical protein
MSEGLASAGLTGLTANVGRRESAQQELATLGKLVEMKKQKEVEEQQAALIEQQYYDKIRAEADKMLVGDRKAINEKSKSIQGQIRQQIKAFGGSRAKFMANGGLSMIGDYTNQVLNSDEVQQYKENKINLERLFDAQGKKLGHLISDGDMQSLRNYQSEGKGKIKYSGLMNELVMPDEMAFAFGTQATATDILYNEENFMKTVGNFQIDHPEMAEEMQTWSQAKLHEEMRAYATAKGYAVHGKNTAMAAAMNQSRGTGGNPANAKETLVKKVSGALAWSLKMENKVVSIDQIRNQSLANNEMLRGLYGTVGNEKYSSVGKINGTIIESVGEVAGEVFTLGLWDYDNNASYRIKGGLKLSSQIANAAFKTQNGESYTMVNGVYENFDPMVMDNLHAANGVPIGDKSKLPKGAWRNKGAVMAYKIKAQDGKGYLVVEATDNHGKIDNGAAKRNKTMYSNDMKDEDGNDLPIEGMMSMYVALQDPKGLTYYQEIDFQGEERQSTFGTHMGDYDELSDQLLENKQVKDTYDRNLLRAKVQREGKAEIPIAHETFDNNPVFKAQTLLNEKTVGGDGRSRLMKAFYMSYFDLYTKNEDSPGYDIDKGIEENHFKTVLDGMGMGTYLRSPKYDDYQILSQMRVELSKPQHNTSDEMTENNQILLEKISNYFTQTDIVKGQKPKLREGADFGFTPGSSWEVVKDFKGKSHEEGGIDITIDRKGVNINKGKVKAKKGVVFNGKHFQL